MALKNAEIAAANTTIFDGTQNASYAITVMLITNTSVADKTVTMYAIDANNAVTTPADRNTILYNVTVPAGDTFTLDTEKLVLGPTDKLVLVANVAPGLNATVSYVEL